MKKRVMTFGTFDYLHAGHEHYLEEAKKYGDELITVVSRDQTVRKVKGESPDNDELTRKKNIEKAGLSDKVVLGSLGNKYEVIKKYKPDVICLGYDQYAFTQQLQKELINQKLNTQVIRMQPYEPETFKSSIIKMQHEAA